MKSTHRRFDVQLLDEDDLLAVARDHEQRIVDGMKAGRTITGEAIGQYKAGPRKGRPITLRDTGRLQAGIKARRAIGGARVDSEATYSRHVFERFPEVMQIDPDSTTDALERAFDAKQVKP